MRDTDYYNAESSQYSSKRYPAVPSTYVQAFFLRRLAVVRSLVGTSMQGSGMKLLEIGCADGVVTFALSDAYSDRFASIAAVDISPEMIREARAHAGGRAIDFGLRQSYPYSRPYDLVVEVGVINYADEDEELRFARELVGSSGLYLCSIAGSDSLKNRLKRDEAAGFNNFRTYAQYEAKIREKFAIERIVPIGIFIPHIWKLPALARIAQPLAELIFAPIAPNLFHEKVYLLRPLSH